MGIIAFIFIILLAIGFLGLPYVCDIELDSLEMENLEHDLGYFSKTVTPVIPKQIIHHCDGIATIFLN